MDGNYFIDNQKITLKQEPIRSEPIKKSNLYKQNKSIESQHENLNEDLLFFSNVIDDFNLLPEFDNSKPIPKKLSNKSIDKNSHIDFLK